MGQRRCQRFDDRSWLRPLGVQLRRARKHAGLTTSELASLLELSKQSIEAFEQARRAVTVATILRWAKACDVSPSAVFSSLDELSLPPPRVIGKQPSSQTIPA